MPRVEHTHARLDLGSAVRSIFSIEFGFAPFTVLHAHILGFGFKVLYQHNEQFTTTVRVPFFEWGRTRIATRFDAVTQEVLNERERSDYTGFAETVKASMDERNGRTDRFAERAGLNQDSKDRPGR